MWPATFINIRPLTTLQFLPKLAAVKKHIRHTAVLWSYFLFNYFPYSCDNCSLYNTTATAATSHCISSILPRLPSCTCPSCIWRHAQPYSTTIIIHGSQWDISRYYKLILAPTYLSYRWIYSNDVLLNTDPNINKCYNTLSAQNSNLTCFFLSAEPALSSFAYSSGQQMYPHPSQANAQPPTHSNEHIQLPYNPSYCMTSDTHSINPKHH